MDSNLKISLADFGSAAICKNPMNKNIDFDSAISVGSQEYNAPEMNMEKVYNGESADIFSAGVCLFVLVMGSCPFRIANIYDPYFNRLTKKDKSEYWKIFSSSAKVSEEFMGN